MSDREGRLVQLEEIGAATAAQLHAMRLGGVVAEALGYFGMQTASTLMQAAGLLSSPLAPQMEPPTSTLERSQRLSTIGEEFAALAAGLTAGGVTPVELKGFNLLITMRLLECGLVPARVPEKHPWE